MEPVDRWKNRRRMAWLTIIAALLFPMLVLIKDSAQLSAIAPHFYVFALAVVIAYIGGAVVDDKWQKVKNDSDNTAHQ
ncbi:MAG: hypothetical protein NBV66_13020 [Burkholderiaceae bacterium]|nr:hypothetical protein [Burkholderiaceae bacterium]